MKPRLLDLFCGAGGAGWGYHLAGFEIVGVDIVDQPRYPGEFHQGDAMDVLAFGPDWWCDPGSFDAIHASPPCQAFTAYRRTGNVGEYPDLIQPVRNLLNQIGRPYVIENVAGAPLECDLMLCGSMFDGPTIDIQRHRFFESNIPLEPPAWPCRHQLSGRDRFPGGRSKERTGSSRGLVRGTVEIGSWDIPFDVQKRAMGIDWMRLEELSEAVPPVYTEFIGHQLIQEISAAKIVAAQVPDA